MSNRLILIAAMMMTCAAARAQEYGIVGRDGGWKGPVPDEFRVKREAVYEFARKPKVTRKGDTITIRFTSKAYCDATVAIEDDDGKIIRHLASGVLGPKAPGPFKKNSKEQVLVWDGKNDQGVYVDDKDALTVRVSLGLKPQFERTLLWSPHKQRGPMPMFAAAPEGVYVFDAGGVDHLRLFDHDGNYVRTIYPFPANKLKEVKGLRWYKFPQGYSWPLKESLYQQTFLTSGVNDNVHDRLGMDAGAAAGIAVRGTRIAFGFEHLNRLSTDGASGGLPLKGPEMGFVLTDRRKQRAYVIGPASLAFSPDGKTLYYTGWMWSGRFNTSSIPAVMRLDYESGDKAAVFVGSWDRDKFGNGDRELCVPTSVACGPKGNVYVSDFLNNRVQVFSPAGKLLKSIGIKKPAKVLVHQKTGAIYVFSWAPFGIPNKAWKKYKYDPKDTQPALTFFSPYPECKKLSAEPFPFGGSGQSVYMNQGARYRIEIDSWAPGKEPTFWLMGNVWMASRVDHAFYFISATKQLAEGRWINGVRILKKRDGKWRAVVNFGRLAKKKVKRVNAIRHNIQELFVNPANGKLYVGETDSGPVSKAYNRLIEIDPVSGTTRFVTLPFNAEEIVFDVNGLVYLRTTDVVARYDPTTWREVPFDYGEQLKGVGCAMGGRSANVIAGIRMPSIHPGQFQQGGMSISPKGHLVVACIQKGKGAGKKWHRDFAHFGVAKNFAKPYRPQMYPGRPGGTCLHIWDKYGKVLRQDVVMGLPQLDGVHIDRDDNIYAMAWPTRVLNGKRYFNYMSETLMKFPAGKGKFLVSGKRAPVPLPANLKPDRPHDVNGRWAEDAEWFYGGVGFAGFNTPHANGGCACWYCRFTMDYFARSFAPEMDQFSVAILDSSGNLITRVGTYGNVDDGVPLIKAGGPKAPRSIGGDEVALFHAGYVGTHTDRRLFIADLGNARIVSVKLDYHVTQKVALKDILNEKKVTGNR
jgi:NHL repeat-containing protein